MRILSKNRLTEAVIKSNRARFTVSDGGCHMTRIRWQQWGYMLKFPLYLTLWYVLYVLHIRFHICLSTNFFSPSVLLYLWLSFLATNWHFQPKYKFHWKVKTTLDYLCFSIILFINFQKWELCLPVRIIFYS